MKYYLEYLFVLTRMSSVLKATGNKLFSDKYEKF